MEEYPTNQIPIFLSVLAPQIIDIMELCMLRGFEVPCDELFTNVLTDRGLCFTFNMLNGDKLYKKTALHFMLPQERNISWTLDDGYVYEPNQPIDQGTYPFRVLDSRRSLGLQFMLRHTETDYLCRGSVQDYWVALHSPDETPQMKNKFFLLPLGSNVLAAVRPKVIKTLPRMRDYAPNRRQCLFSSERELQFFRVYKQHHCEMECLADYTLKACGCVLFSMPRQANTPVCNLSARQCAWDAEGSLELQKYESTLSGHAERVGCNCLPDCSSIKYDAEISLSPINSKEFQAALNLTIDNSSRTAMIIFFEDTQFIASERSELFGTVGFLANIGGLLGLFLGMSVLSVVELVYFCSLRLFWNLSMRTNHTHDDGDVEKTVVSMGMMASPHAEQRMAMLTLLNCQS